MCILPLGMLCFRGYLQLATLRAVSARIILATGAVQRPGTQGGWAPQLPRRARQALSAVAQRAPQRAPIPCMGEDRDAGTNDLRMHP